MTPCLELIRVSTEGQAASDRASIPAQREVNQRTAKAYNLRIIKTIEIINVSGAAVLLSPGMKQLLALIEDPEIKGVVTREFSRLMRPEDFEDYALLAAFANTGTKLYLPDGPIDFDSKSGRLMGGIRAMMAGIERSEILERIWSAKESKRRAGGFAQSAVCLPYGVTFDGHWSYTSDAQNVREAFRLLLGGQLSYSELGEAVGIPPFNLRLILRNPIYTGWRVIDKERDKSARGRRSSTDGKQADRPKINRAPEDVIRIRVIDTPLVSESDFLKAQQLMDAKKTRHWRTQKAYQRRFLFNGFLNCGECGNVVYSSYQRDDYYVCKGRRLHLGCETGFMRRDILDPQIDSMIVNQFRDREFLYRIAEAWKAQQSGDSDEQRRRGLDAQLSALQLKRSRTLDAYVDGAMERAERDKRLAEIKKDMERVSDVILRAEPRPALTAEALADVFQVFEGWEYLERDDKRRILSITAPEIKVANYRIQGLYLFERGNEVNRKGKAYPIAPFYVPLNVGV